MQIQQQVLLKVNDIGITAKSLAEQMDIPVGSATRALNSLYRGQVISREKIDGNTLYKSKQCPLAI